MPAFINYYNVRFVVMLKSERDEACFEVFKCRIERKGTTLMGIKRWCDTHKIEYAYKFYWKDDYTIRANLWNLYSYLRFRWDTRKKAQP